MRKYLLFFLFFISFSLFSETLSFKLAVSKNKDCGFKKNIEYYLDCGSFKRDKFFQIKPGENIKPSRKTEVRVCVCGNAIIFAFKCEYKKGDRINQPGERDALGDNDIVSIEFDPFGKGTNFYYINIDPLNNVSDGLYSPFSGGYNSDFDFIFKSKTVVKRKYWYAVIYIPFSSINIPSSSKQKWLVGIHRTIPLKNYREEENIVKKDRNSNDIKDGMVYFEFIKPEKKARQKRLKLIPSLVVSHLKHDEEFFGNADNYNSDKGDLGLTVEYSPSTNTVFKGTIHPDFSQVEADDTYQRVNNRYPVYLREKRPFFMDGMESFSTPFELLYTRRIVKPEYGLKFSTKLKNKYGIYLISAMEKDVPSERFGYSDEFKKDVYWNVVRTTYNLDNRGSFLGFMAIERNYGADYNRVIGLDGYLNKGKWGFLYQGVLSKLDSKGNNLTGNGLYLSLSYKPNKYMKFACKYNSLSPDFVNDAGFFYRTDYRTYTLYSRFTYLPSTSNTLVKSASLTLIYDESFNYRSVMINQRPHISGQVLLKNFVFVKATYQTDNDEYKSHIYPTYNFNFQFSWMKYPLFRPVLFFGKGHVILYGNNPRLVDEKFGYLMLSSSTKKIRFSGTVFYFVFSELHTGVTIRKQWSCQLSSTYYITERTNFKVFYQTFLADMKDMNFNQPYHYINLLFTWRKNAFTKLYIGYNNGHSTYRMTDKTMWGFDRDKYFYAKITYLF